MCVVFAEGLQHCYQASLAHMRCRLFGSLLDFTGIYKKMYEKKQNTS